MGLFNKKNKDTTSSSDGNSYLKISMTKDGSEYTFLLEGRLDTVTSPNLESRINEVIGDATKLTLDFAKLEYISSAGLRVLLGALPARRFAEDGRQRRDGRPQSQSVCTGRLCSYGLQPAVQRLIITVRQRYNGENI